VFVETHKGALPLQDGGQHIVMDELFGGPWKK
jgi:hypothetical protein